jgi:putative transposase
MTVRQKSYKFRIYPTKEQTVMFSKTFGCTRAIWNMMLADKIKHYEETGQTLKNTPAQLSVVYRHLELVRAVTLNPAKAKTCKAQN